MTTRKSWTLNKDLLVFKSFYFFFFGAIGAINPFLPVYLRQIGLSAFAVGLLVGFRPIVQLASAPFWTVIADKFRKRKAILIMSVMAWLIMTIALVFIEPTEEICELTARNNTHLIFVNYTKHKTGFFKRSFDKPSPLSSRIARMSQEKSRRGVQIFHFKQNNLNTYTKDKSSAGIKLDSLEQKGQQIYNKNQQAEKNNDKQSNTTPSGQIVTKSTSAHHNNKDNKNKMEMGEKIKFDPFNMNGKSKSSDDEQLAKFLAISHNNQNGDILTDVHYYNMNKAESQHNQSENQTSFKHSARKRLNKSKKPVRLLTKRPVKFFATERPSLEAMQFMQAKTRDKNTTITLTKINLFKSNSNEMKRLFVILLVLIVVGEFLETPSAPLSDASLLEYLGENRINYGKQRLYGSLGHGIASFIVGIFLERSRHTTCDEEFIDYTSSFCVFTLFMMTTLVISANFSFRYKDFEETKNSLLSTVLTAHYTSFLTAVCYMGMCHGLINNFLMWFLEDLGGSKTLMGLSICSRAFADIITFFIASRIIEVLGQIKIVFIALILYAAIFIAYSTTSNPWISLPVEFLGGFTFAASWTACTSYLAEAAPKESVTAMQGILQAVYWGLGTGIGSMLGGHLFHTKGAHWTFRAAATGSFLLASFFAVAQWKWQKENLDDSLGIYNYYSSTEPKDTEALLKDDLKEEKRDDSEHENRRKIKETRKERKKRQDKKFSQR